MKLTWARTEYYSPDSVCWLKMTTRRFASGPSRLILVGQIDNLYQHEVRGDFLVVELKRAKDTSDRAVGQLFRYIGCRITLWLNALALVRRCPGMLAFRCA